MNKLQDIVSEICTRFSYIALVYLFGSRAEGDAGPSSDYDFAVLVDREADGPRVRSELASILARELQTDRIDVVLLHTAPIELAFTVISKGELVYERSLRSRVDYEARVMGLYFDYLPFLRMARQDIVKGEEHAHRARRYRKALGRTLGSLGQVRTAQGKGTA